MWSTPSLRLLRGQHSNRVPSMGKIELFNHLTVGKDMTDVKLNC